MKKAWILLVIIICAGVLLSCTTETDINTDTNTDTNQNPYEEIEFESGEYYNKDWEDSVGTYEGAAVPDKETAIKVAKAVFDGMEKSETEQNFTPQHVYYDTKDEVWIVSFWEEDDDGKPPFIIGGDCSIAIQKSDGKVLRIWFYD